jgi:hypothetical protein
MLLHSLAQRQVTDGPGLAIIGEQRAPTLRLGRRSAGRT